MTRKQSYLLLLQGQSNDWLVASYNSASPYMTATHKALHLIALRRSKSN